MFKAIIAKYATIALSLAIIMSPQLQNNETNQTSIPASKKSVTNGIGWNGLGWNGLGWNGLGWNGIGWNGLGWNGIGWNGLGFNGQETGSSYANGMVFKSLTLKK